MKSTWSKAFDLLEAKLEEYRRSVAVPASLQVTWEQRVQNLYYRYGRPPTLLELREEVKHHTMTPEEYKRQAESWARANVSTGDPRWD